MRAKQHRNSVKADPSNHPDPMVRQYLVRLSNRLKGVVSEEQRNDLVEEQACWLEQSIEEEMLSGVTYEEAAEKVVPAHGDPIKLADRIALELYEDEVNTPVFRTLGRGNTVAVAVFGIATALYMVFLQLQVFLPSGAPINPLFSPADFRVVFPEPLPYPDLSLSFLASMTYPVIAPFICGWICGRLIPVGAVAAVYRTLLTMTVCAFLLGASLLPEKTPILYAVFLATFWLPVGCLTARISSSILRWQRRRQVEGKGCHPSPSANVQEVTSL